MSELADGTAEGSVGAADASNARLRSAYVLTASDRSATGDRDDVSGSRIAERLAEMGFDVERGVVPDDAATISAAIVSATERHPLVVTTGGTGLTPRDVTPQATAAVVDYEIPGIPEAMRAAGRVSTPMASLSRGIAGVRGGTLIVNLPGSPRGALESFDAIAPILDHALETLAGPFDHSAASGRDGRGGRARGA